MQYHDHFTEIGTHFLWKHPASISLPTYIQATIYQIDSSETATFWDLFNRIIFLFRYRLHLSTKISFDFFINQPIKFNWFKKKERFCISKKNGFRNEKWAFQGEPSWFTESTIKGKGVKKSISLNPTLNY